MAKKIIEKNIENKKLWKLMNNQNIFTASELAEKIYNMYPWNNQGNKNAPAGTEEKKAYQNNVDSLSKMIIRDLYNPSSIPQCRLKMYCNYFECSADYLLGYIDMPTHDNTDIYSVTGLSENAINTIKGIKHESENWKRNTRSDSPGYDDLAALNFLLKYDGLISPILRGLQDLCHTEYSVPVHLENGKFVVPNNRYEYQPEIKVSGTKFPEYYYLLLSKSKDAPNDNISIALDRSFFKSLALKKIESTFLEMLEVYKENEKDGD